MYHVKEHTVTFRTARESPVATQLRSEETRRSGERGAFVLRVTLPFSLRKMRGRRTRHEKNRARKSLPMTA